VQAIYFDGMPEYRTVKDPRPGPDEALIRVVAAGICRTDIEITQGYMDFRGILGHEFVGAVLECRSAPELIGKRVVGEINIAPGAKDDLERRHLPERSVLGIVGKDGCFAELITLPVENLHLVPDEVSSLSAVFVEPLAAANEIIEQVSIGAGDKTAVIGDGKLGLLVARVLVLSGAEVTVIGRHDHKLRIAESFGARAILESEKVGRTFDLVVDCSGSPSGLQAALSLLRPRGLLVLKTTTAVAPDFHTAQIVIDEITVVGSRCGPFAPALKLLGALKVLIDVEGTLR